MNPLFLMAFGLLLLMSRRRTPSYGEPGYREAALREQGTEAQRAAREQVQREMRERAKQPPRKGTA